MAGNDGVHNGYVRDKIQRTLRLQDSVYIPLTTYIKHFISEMFGTGLLVFLGCMAVRGKENTHLGVTLSFGLAAFIAIQITCHNSGGHINPCATVLSVFFKKLTIPMALNYIAGQCVGAILGFGLLKGITTGDSNDFCLTKPSAEMTDFQSFMFELVMTSVLMLTICAIWDPRNGLLLDSASMKFGFTIFVLAYVGVPYSGCSMNPARSLGPAVWFNNWEKHWIYWVGPLLGTVLTGAIYTTFFCGPIEAPPSKEKSNRVEMETVTST